MEESILDAAKDENGTLFNPCVIIECGSGMFCKCLSIPANKFVQVAQASSKSMTVCPLIQKKKKNQTQQ